jgi:FtsP/CotA-like multicopper oxidase with cupredoxin domain
MKITRRQFIKGAAAAGVMLSVPFKFGVGTAQAFANSGNLTKWAQPLRGLDYPLGVGHILETVVGYPHDPNGIPVLGGVTPDPGFGGGTTMYDISVEQFEDILHPQLGGTAITQLGGKTKLWGYVDQNRPILRHLGGIIVTTRNQAARLRFTNNLPSTHIIPNDLTIPGANLGSNRIATHLHGGLVPWISDGGPFDWFDPAGVHALSFLNGPTSVLDNIAGNQMVAGQADYYYPNDQSTRLMWYHDHAWGITRINAYAGIATGYLVVDLANDAVRLNSNVPAYADMIPIVFQDKIFVSASTSITDPSWATASPNGQSVGSLWYAHVYDPKLYKLLKSTKYLAPPNPSVVPEFFGDTMLANGTVYPMLTVDPKAYRFMILNACNARFLNINLFDAGLTAGNPNPNEITTDPKTGFALLGTPVGPQITQIGNEAGYLAADVVYPNNLPINPALMKGNLFLASAERADVVIDFSQYAGHTIIMYNDCPAPFPGGAPTNDYYLGNPANPVQPLAGTGPDTRNILRIDVTGTVNGTPTVGPFLKQIPVGTPIGSVLDPPAIAPITTTLAPSPVLVAPTLPTPPRDLTLNEDFDQWGRLRQVIGTTKPALVGGGFGLEYIAPATEIVTAGATEVWRIFNLTADTHPIHFHLVNVQILSRQPFKVVAGIFTPTGVARGPEPEELGWKETVKMHPGEVTSVIMRFDLPTGLPFPVPESPRTGGNEFVYHCHILEHEEHDMMRPLVVLGVTQVALLHVDPPTAGLTGKKGGTVTYLIGGGTAPYTVTSSNAAIAPVTMAATGNGFSVTVKNNTALATVTFTVTDQSAQTVYATLTII